MYDFAIEFPAIDVLSSRLITAFSSREIVQPPNPFLLPSNTFPLIVATRLLNDSVNFVVYYLRANILV